MARRRIVPNMIVDDGTPIHKGALMAEGSKSSRSSSNKRPPLVRKDRAMPRQNELSRDRRRSRRHRRHHVRRSIEEKLDESFSNSSVDSASSNGTATTASTFASASSSSSTSVSLSLHDSEKAKTISWEPQVRVRRFKKLDERYHSRCFYRRSDYLQFQQEAYVEAHALRAKEQTH